MLLGIELIYNDWNLAIECDEKGHKDCDTEHEIKRQRAIAEKLWWKFIKHNPYDP